MVQDMPTPRPATPTHRLADHLLGDRGPLEDFVRSRRADGRSWRLIARDLYEATDRGVDLTYQTLWTWFPDSAEELDQASAEATG